MKTGVRFCVLSVASTLLPMVAHAEWRAVEKVETYAITGKSGGELYASIGERGPKVGGDISAIAHTNFVLTWSRKYEPQGNACTLVSARPKLTITYTLPKPTGTLPVAMQKNWETFIAGVRAHELVHGDQIKDMVKKIEIASVGLSAPDDPKCQKVRVELTKHLSALSQSQRQQSRDFDRSEMSGGGNVHQLILKLVNGQ